MIALITYLTYYLGISTAFQKMVQAFCVIHGKHLWYQAPDSGWKLWSRKIQQATMLLDE